MLQNFQSSLAAGVLEHDVVDLERVHFTLAEGVGHSALLLGTRLCEGKLQALAAATADSRLAE